MPTGMLCGECIQQAVQQHAVVECGVPHPIAPTTGWQQVGRTVHVLHAPGDGRIKVAEPDFISGCRDGLSTGSAHPIDGHGGYRYRQARSDGGLARRIHLVAGLDDVTEYDTADQAGINT